MSYGYQYYMAAMMRRTRNKEFLALRKDQEKILKYFPRSVRDNSSNKKFVTWTGTESDAEFLRIHGIPLVEA